MKRLLVCSLVLLLSLPLAAQEPLTVIGWNLESGGADVAVIADRIEIAALREMVEKL